jgi:hypothetical protein
MTRLAAAFCLVALYTSSAHALTMVEKQCLFLAAEKLPKLQHATLVSTSVTKEDPKPAYAKEEKYRVFINIALGGEQLTHTFSCSVSNGSILILPSGISE